MVSRYHSIPFDETRFRFGWNWWHRKLLGIPAAGKQLNYMPITWSGCAVVGNDKTLSDKGARKRVASYTEEFIEIPGWTDHPRAPEDGARAYILSSLTRNLLGHFRQKVTAFPEPKLNRKWPRSSEYNRSVCEVTALSVVYVSR